LIKQKDEEALAKAKLLYRSNGQGSQAAGARAREGAFHHPIVEFLAVLSQSNMKSFRRQSNTDSRWAFMPSHGIDTKEPPPWHGTRPSNPNQSLNEIASMPGLVVLLNH
jgi:hypothetical protein